MEAGLEADARVDGDDSVRYMEGSRMDQIGFKSMKTETTLTRV